MLKVWWMESTFPFAISLIVAIEIPVWADMAVSIFFRSPIS